MGVFQASPISGVAKSKSKTKLEGGAPEMKEIQFLKSDDPTDIYCIGDNINILKFTIGEMNWMKIPVDNDKQSVAAFEGMTRYSSVCYCPPQPDAKLILTGGCHV